MKLVYLVNPQRKKEEETLTEKELLTELMFVLSRPPAGGATQASPTLMLWQLYNQPAHRFTICIYHLFNRPTFQSIWSTSFPPFPIVSFPLLQNELNVWRGETDEWVEAGPNQADVPPDPRIELLHQLQHYWISTPPIQTQNTLETIEEKCIHLHVHCTLYMYIVQPVAHKTFVKYVRSRSW